MAQPAIGAPYSACSWKVSQRKAPGAISAIALIVSPVKPRVALEVEGLPPPPDEFVGVCAFAMMFRLLFP